MLSRGRWAREGNDGNRGNVSMVVHGGRKAEDDYSIRRVLDCGIDNFFCLYPTFFFFFWDRVLEQYEEEYIYLPVSKVEPIKSARDIYIASPFPLLFMRPF